MCRIFLVTYVCHVVYICYVAYNCCLVYACYVTYVLCHIYLLCCTCQLCHIYQLCRICQLCHIFKICQICQLFGILILPAIWHVCYATFMLRGIFLPCHISSTFQLYRTSMTAVILFFPAGTRLATQTKCNVFKLFGAHKPVNYSSVICEIKSVTFLTETVLVTNETRSALLVNSLRLLRICYKCGVFFGKKRGHEFQKYLGHDALKHLKKRSYHGGHFFDVIYFEPLTQGVCTGYGQSLQRLRVKIW